MIQAKINLRKKDFGNCWNKSYNNEGRTLKQKLVKQIKWTEVKRLEKQNKIFKKIKPQNDRQNFSAQISTERFFLVE